MCSNPVMTNMSVQKTLKPVNNYVVAAQGGLQIGVCVGSRRAPHGRMLYSKWPLSVVAV
jgi:hypothetical protein